MKKYNFDQCRLIKMRHRLVVFSLDGDAKTSLFLFLSQCKNFLGEQELPELNVGSWCWFRVWTEERNAGAGLHHAEIVFPWGVLQAVGITLERFFSFFFCVREIIWKFGQISDRWFGHRALGESIICLVCMYDIVSVINIHFLQGEERSEKLIVTIWKVKPT